MKCPGIDIPTGSLGQGLACAVGMAIALKMDKFEAFGFDVYNIDGNDMAQIVRTLDTIRMRHDHKPKCIFAQTTKGKGVSYMENIAAWHGVAPNKEQYEQAIKDIDSDYSFN